MFALTRRTSCRALRYLATTTTTTTATAAVAASTNGLTATQAKTLSQIADDIARLSILEVSELAALLKVRLNIPDAPMQMMAMPGSAMMMASNAANEKDEEDEEAEKPAAKVVFKVTLASVKKENRAALIREVKAQSSTPMSLVEAMKIVDNLPKVLHESLPKEDAEKLKATLEKAGGTVTVD